MHSHIKHLKVFTYIRILWLWWHRLRYGTAYKWSPEPWNGSLGCPEYALLPCTREAMDAYAIKRYGTNYPAHPYPNEYFEDKNNRLMGKATGHVRVENVGRGAKVVWVKHKP